MYKCLAMFECCFIFEICKILSSIVQEGSLQPEPMAYNHKGAIKVILHESYGRKISRKQAVSTLFVF